ncbi:hypothetical protein [Dokdonia sp.]|uniref:hypothetical protein n=1 Tax=Dokdonia sp. TaxID=2024995 RepID=UPI003263912F
MKNSIILFLVTFFAITSCKRNMVNNSENEQTFITNHRQKDIQMIQESFEKMTNGFKNNSLSEFYELLDEKAIIIDGNGNEVYDKTNIVAHFKSRLKTKKIKLTSWKLHELIVSDSLALSKAEYQITYLENEEIIGYTDSNWHIVWKKNTIGDWQILREIFNEKK